MPTHVSPTSPVRSLDWDEPISVDGGLPIRVLAGVLDRFRVGAVLVASPGGDASIVSERDVVATIADGADPDHVRVRDIVAPALITASPHERIVDVARRMTDHQVRHIAIVDRDQIVGMLSMRDVCAVLLDDLERDAS